MTARVLVVDDDPGLQETLTGLLDFEGYETHVAANGVEALERIEQARPDLILLDLMMPRMNGWALVDELRRRRIYPGIPVVVLSADGRAREKAAQIGASDGLAKPFDVDELLLVVRQLLERGGT